MRRGIASFRLLTLVVVAVTMAILAHRAAERGKPARPTIVAGGAVLREGAGWRVVGHETRPCGWTRLIVSVLEVRRFDAWREVRCRRLDLRGFRWEFGSLSGLTLDGADLHDVSLPCLRVTNVSLRGANLDGVNLQASVLLNCDLRGASLRGAHLTGCDLRGARLDRAILSEAEYQTTTQWPPGFDPQSHKARLVE
jgi:hypothetical protein